ncbi:MAG: hypothetical protein ACE5I7_00535 [Candidatus Binatia bacterium]
MLVRPQVVEDVGHVLGNLFQRIYHLIGLTSATDAAVAAQLQCSTQHLEEFLQLAVDYFAPLSLKLEYLSGMEIAQGLARQMSDALGSSVMIGAKLPDGGRLLVDPGRLAHAFTLLALQLHADDGCKGGIEAKVLQKPAGRSMVLRASIPSRCVSTPSSEAEVQWAVAEKLLEIQGGSLQQKTVSSGEVLWEILLPFQP